MLLTEVKGRGRATEKWGRKERKRERLYPSIFIIYIQITPSATSKSNV